MLRLLLRLAMRTALLAVGRELKTTCAPNECRTPPWEFKIVAPNGDRRLEPD